MHLIVGLVLLGVAFLAIVGTLASLVRIERYDGRSAGLGVRPWTILAVWWLAPLGDAAKKRVGAVLTVASVVLYMVAFAADTWYNSTVSTLAWAALSRIATAAGVAFSWPAVGFGLGALVQSLHRRAWVEALVFWVLGGSALPLLFLHASGFIGIWPPL